MCGLKFTAYPSKCEGRPKAPHRIITFISIDQDLVSRAKLRGRMHMASGFDWISNARADSV